MESRDRMGNYSWQDGSQQTDGWQPVTGPAVLVQTAIATTAVVGFFAAASQPFSWLAVLQAFVSAAIGLSLWLSSASPRPRETKTAPIALGSALRR